MQIQKDDNYEQYFTIVSDKKLYRIIDSYRIIQSCRVGIIWHGYISKQSLSII